VDRGAVKVELGTGMDVVGIEVVTGSGGPTALEVETTGTRVGAVEVKLRTGIDVVKVGLYAKT
jgi:hypothetical protein